MRVDNNLSALSAFGTSLAVSANNVANINTEGFKASQAALETGPQDQGVRVAEIRRDESPGPLVQSLQRVEDPDTGRIDTQWQYVEGSNTDLARETVNMITAQRAYEANIDAARTMLDAEGSLLNEII